MTPHWSHPKLAFWGPEKQHFFYDFIIQILLVWLGLKIIKHLSVKDDIGFPCQYKHNIGIQN